MSNELDNLRGQLRTFAAARNWERFHSPKNLAAAMAVEAAEVPRSRTSSPMFSSI